MVTSSMIQGVGLFRSFSIKSPTLVSEVQTLIQDHVFKKQKSQMLRRATAVEYNSNQVTLIEEWSSLDEYHQATKSKESDLEIVLDKYLSKPPFCEFFDHCLHIGKALDDEKATASSSQQQDIGILVRQATKSAEHGIQLRDAQREAYERQMPLEPGCTCCIILSSSSSTHPNNPHQVRIVELWHTMQDFIDHESSEWHALGETKVAPLVIDMDCDFCKGTRLLV